MSVPKSSLRIFTLPIVFFCLLLLSTNVWSQKSWGGMGGFSIGYLNSNADGFQQFLPDGAPQLSSNYLLIGGEGYSLVNRFMLGGKGYGIIGDNMTYVPDGSDAAQATLGGGAGFFTLGYAVVSSQNWLVYPRLGIGGGGIALNLSSLETVSVDQIKSGNYFENTISRGAFMLDFSIGADLFPLQGGQGLVLGFRAGYTLAITNENWSYTGGNIVGASNDGINGFHFSFVIGGGGGG